MSPPLTDLLRHPAIWRAGRPAAASYGTLATGFTGLDAALPGGGWPVGALTEIFTAGDGIGELRLIMPALARLSSEGRWIVWVTPPYIPYAPALQQEGMDL
ncbi:MAG: SOS cell division inhibitor SulA, partial [Gammaproteobacteria bacterium]|nr:SOS cell division inhibitor SulA [Gammaproteobacteria bacterium]